MADTNLASAEPQKKFIHEYEGMHVYDGFVLPGIFPAQCAEEAKQFPFEEGDVVVCTYPKSGTIWMQEIIWMLHNSADTVASQQVMMHERVVSLDSMGIASLLQKRAPPRLFRTHWPRNIYEKAIDEGKVKFIVVIRNPKDVLVSFYNFYRMLECYGSFQGSWSQFLEMYENKELSFGDWFEHVLEYWKLRDRPNVLIVTYEDMKRDILKIVEKVASFCKLQVSDEIITKTVMNSSFTSMSSNPATNFETVADKFGMDLSKSKYLRKGAVGDWKNYFTVAQNEWFDEQFKQKMAGSGLHIDFVI